MYDMKKKKKKKVLEEHQNLKLKETLASINGSSFWKTSTVLSVRLDNQMQMF